MTKAEKFHSLPIIICVCIHTKYETLHRNTYDIIHPTVNDGGVQKFVDYALSIKVL